MANLVQRQRIWTRAHSGSSRRLLDHVRKLWDLTNRARVVDSENLNHLCDLAQLDLFALVAFCSSRERRVFLAVPHDTSVVQAQLPVVVRHARIEHAEHRVEIDEAGHATSGGGTEKLAPRGVLIWARAGRRRRAAESDDVDAEYGVGPGEAR